VKHVIRINISAALLVVEALLFLTSGGALSVSLLFLLPCFWQFSKSLNLSAIATTIEGHVVHSACTYQNCYNDHHVHITQFFLIWFILWSCCLDDFLMLPNSS
jgi:hypothetical protein